MPGGPTAPAYAAACGERLHARLRPLRSERGGPAGGADLDGQRLPLHSGAAEWEDVDEVHYPGTYAHGVYDRETTIMGGRPVPNEDLVNLPNCFVLKFRVEGEEPFRLGNVELLSYRHAYDARNAVVIRELRFRDRAGRETSLKSRRFVSMGRMHLAALAWEARAGELVGPGRGGVRAGRAGPEQGRRPVPAAEGPSPRSPGTPDLQLRRDRAQGAHPPVEDRDRPSRAHPRLSRRGRARGRSQHATRRRTTSSRSWPSMCKRARPCASRS